MRKIKLMLFTFVLLTIVGGALASKAKYTGDLCITTFYDFNEGRTTCPSLLVAFKSTVIFAPTYYTTTAQNEDCTYRDESNKIHPITCNTWTSVTRD